MALSDYYSRLEAEAARLRECVLCFEDIDVSKGVECGSAAERHFVCDEHFAPYVRAQSTTEALAELAARKGNVFCPACPNSNTAGEGSTAYSDQEVAQHCDSASYNLFMRGKATLQEAALVARLEAENEARMTAALEGMRHQTEQQRNVEQARRRLEAMLDMQCPRCHTVLSFDAFSGCMAVRCPRAGCGAGFCAWCLADCDESALVDPALPLTHNHVGRCPEKITGRDAYYDTSCVLGADVLCECKDGHGADRKCFVFGKQVQRRLQATAVTAHLRSLEVGVRAEVIEACRGLLEHSRLESVLAAFDGEDGEILI